MIRVGVTGGIGSGKSTVCALFERLGVPVYDSDRRARELVNGLDETKYDDKISGNRVTGDGGNPGGKSGALRRAIVALLGDEAYCGDRLDSAFVADKVFVDKILLASLNAIVHPAVAEDFEAWALAVESSSRHPYLIIESAILFESGFDRFVDKTIAVTAPEQLRLERVVSRGRNTRCDSGNGENTGNTHRGRISRTGAIRRTTNQLGDDERNARADYTIDNSGGLPELAARVEELDKLLKLL